MEEVKRKLINAIKRSQYAYESYLNDKKYFQALRIKNANLAVYSLLQDFLLGAEEDQVQPLCDYIFHLEDWFNQFSNQERENPELEDSFVFERLKGSFAYPKHFVTSLK